MNQRIVYPVFPEFGAGTCIHLNFERTNFEGTTVCCYQGLVRYLCATPIKHVNVSYTPYIVEHCSYHLSSPSQLFFSLGPVGPSSLDSSLGILFSMVSALHLSREGRRPTIHSIRFLDLYTTVGPHSRMNCSHCGSTTAPSPRYSAATMRYLALESTNSLLRAASLRMPIPSAAEPCRYTPGYA